MPHATLRHAAFLTLAFAALAAAGARADDPPPAAGPPRVAELVGDLDADDEAVRTRAESELLALGEAARAGLEAARPAAGPEARRRIDGILARLDAAKRTSAPAEWPGLRGGPERSGVAGGALPRKEPKVLWKADVPDGSPLQGALLATPDTVVTLSESGSVRSFAAADGARRWIAVLDAPVTASAALAGGRVVVPTAKGAVALDARDGREAWRVEAAYGCRAAPAVLGDRVFVSLRNEGVVAVDLATGERRMERKLAPMGALLADRDLLVVGTEDGSLRSLDPATGEDRWKLDLGGAPVMGPTLAAPGIVVVMGRDRTLRGLRAADGKQVWLVRVAALSPSESLAAAAGRIFVNDTGGTVHAFDAATGRSLWNRNEGFTTMGAPAATADAVCFSSRGRIGCRDAGSGDFLWRIDTERRDSSSPVAAGGRIFVLDSGQLRCLGETR